MVQQVLTNKDEFEHNTLFKVIDNAISNELGDIANRTNAVNTAIASSS
jgi:hypothetical protein